MRYPLVIIALSLVAGAIGNANDLPAVRELAALALVGGLIMLGRAAWDRFRSRRQSDV